MFTVNINYDAKTRILADASGSDDYTIATVGDNESTKLVFNITDTDGLLTGLTGRVEFDVWIHSSDNTVFKPYLLLDAENSVTLPNYILAGATRSTLPIQIAFSDDNGNTQYSFNKLTYSVRNAVGAIDAQAEAVPDTMLAYVEVTIDPETNTLTFIRLNGSTTDVSVASLEGNSFDYEWQATSLIVKIVDYEGNVVSESAPVNLLGDSLTFSWSGTTLTVNQVDNAGNIIATGSANLKGERGYPFRIMKIYSSVAEMDADFDTCGLTEGELVAIQSNVEDPDNARLYAKGTTQWEFIVDMSGATGIQGPQGDSLSASFSGTTLTVTETDYLGNVVATDSANLKGDSLEASFNGTTLTIDQVNNAGQVVDSDSANLKGDSLEASFSGSVLTIQQIKNDGTVVDTDSQNLKGDSLQATFDGPVLTVKQVDNAGTQIASTSQNLLGDGLSAQFSGTTLNVTQKNNAGQTVATTSSNLKGDSLEAQFSGTVLTVDQVNVAGQTVATTSSDLKGDSLQASFSGTVLTIDQVNNAGTVVDTDSQDLKGDSLRASFDGEVLTVEQVNSAGTVVDTESQNLKGDSLEASFSGTTLIVEQVNNAGQVVDTDSANLKGDSLEAQFNGTVLVVNQVDSSGTVVATTSQDLQADKGGSTSFIIGDGSTREFDIQHNLGVYNPFWTCQDITTPGHFEYVSCFAYSSSPNVLHVVFNTAPLTNSIKITCSSGFGTEGASADSYEFVQSTASATWTINHGLGRRTSFTVIDSAGTVMLCAEKIVDINTTVEYFGSPTSGMAIER